MIDPTYYDASEPEEAARLAARPRASPNTLTVIGWLGIRRAYLNVPEKEAIERWKKDEGVEDEPSYVLTFEFTDTFGVYDAGPT